MDIRTFNVTSETDGTVLAAAMTVPPEGAPVKGIVQFVHGMVEHKERYYPLMQCLTGRGYVCLIHDLRGHGASVRTPKDLGFMGKGGWRAIVDDVLTVGNTVRGSYGTVPYTLIGHSMGSMVVRCYLKRYDDTIDRLIVSGCPSDNPAKGIGKALANVIGTVKGWHHRPKILQKISFAGYNKPFENEGYSKAWVCSDPEILEEYHNDPLCSFVFTVDGFKNLYSFMQDCYGRSGWKVSNPRMPIRFLSGGEDPCRKSDKAFFKAVSFLGGRGYSDVHGKLYPGMRHEIFMEKDKETVWNDILSELEG